MVILCFLVFGKWKKSLLYKSDLTFSLRLRTKSHGQIFILHRIPCTGLGKLSKLKDGETLDWVQSGNDPPPPSGIGTFSIFGLYWNGLISSPFPLNQLRRSGMNSKQFEYEKYWYKINQYEWYNGIFGHV